MLNAGDAVGTLPAIIDYQDPAVADQMARGQMNTAEERQIANIASAIRRGYPQFRTGPNRGERICLVGSGPSLESTLPELRQLVWEGATLVTLNGAYHWCIERNLRPQTQIVMDARPSNVKFVEPDVPKCNYMIASQCASALWDAVAGRPNVWIWHPVVRTEGGPTKLLDDFYGGQWVGIGGGTTVATRAIYLLRTAGYLRFDLFGIDCCWMQRYGIYNTATNRLLHHGVDGQPMLFDSREEADLLAPSYADYGIAADVREISSHHAMPQPENDGDVRTKRRVTVSIKGAAESREFLASGWHLKQLDDMLTTMHVNGKHYKLEVHGDGMLAYVMRVLGTAAVDDLIINKE
jgi:hypothetical protein